MKPGSITPAPNDVCEECRKTYAEHINASIYDWCPDRSGVVFTPAPEVAATSDKKTGIELIAEERVRQIEKENWNVEHDEDHTAMQLSSAAGCYIASAHQKYFDVYTHGNESGKYSRFQVYDENHPQRPKWVDGWPWDDEFDKREKHDVMRSLVIAGALIAAEIDRLQNS